jgi:SET domain-containing protein
MAGCPASPVAMLMPDTSAARAADLVEVRHSPVHGHGVFALRDLARGQSLGFYEGRRLGPREVARRDWNRQLTFVFGLSDGSVIDGGAGGNALRHLNHSCAPNCVAWEVDGDDGRPQIVIETHRKVRAGEELFIDYALDAPDADPAEFPCHCGSARCRGSMLADPSPPVPSREPAAL